MPNVFKFIINDISIQNTEAILDCSLAVLEDKANVELNFFLYNDKGVEEKTLGKYILNPSEDNTTTGATMLDKSSSFNIYIDLTKNNEGKIYKNCWHRELYLIIKDSNNVVIYKSTLLKLFSEKQYYPTFDFASVDLKATFNGTSDNRRLQIKTKDTKINLTNYNLKNTPCFTIEAILSYIDNNNQKTRDTKIIEKTPSNPIQEFDFDDSKFVIQNLYKYARLTFNVCALNGDIITSTSKIVRLRTNYTHMFYKTPEGIKRIKSVSYRDDSGKVYTMTDANVFNMFDIAVYNFVRNLNVVDNCYIEHSDPTSNVFTERHIISVTEGNVALSDLVFSFSRATGENDIELGEDNEVVANETYDKIETMPKSKIVARGVDGFYCETTVEDKQYKLKFKTKIKTYRHVIADSELSGEHILYPSDYLAPDLN